MLYSNLVVIYQSLEKTSKRLEKAAILAEFLKNIPSTELATVVNLLQGRVFPQWDSRNMGFSSRLMLKALHKATGASLKSIESSWNKLGDLGKVASELVKNKTQVTFASQELNIKKVIINLQKLESVEGSGSVERKVSLVAELITSASPEESRFLVRTVLEELRVGIASGIMRDAIALAFDQEIKVVEHAFDVVGDFGEVAVFAKKNALSSLELTSGRPLNSMLAILVQDIPEAFKALGSPAQFEFKLDGFRLQVHKSNGKIKLFTRRLEEVTKQFPEVVAVIQSSVSGDSFILDAEAVGIDPKSGKNLPFQHMSQRIKRKHDIALLAKRLPVELNVFDIVLYNGKNVMDCSQDERRKLLEKIVKPQKNKLKFTEMLTTGDEKKAVAFYKKSLDDGNEGLMIKSLSSVYRPGRYVSGWCKLKPTLEPLDVVITSALWGEGKRSEWLASFTVAVKSGEKFVEIGKVGTGVKEKVEEGVSFEELTKLLKPLIISKKGREVKVKPQIVVEVAYEELQKSPTYSSGFAMRFPRILRLRSNEKVVNDVNSLRDVERIYVVQKGKV